MVIDKRDTLYYQSRLLFQRSAMAGKQSSSRQLQIKQSNEQNKLTVSEYVSSIFTLNTDGEKCPLTIIGNRIANLNYFH